MILVTGASGTVGGEVVRQLVSAGHRVRAFVRDETAATRLGAEPAVGDLDRPETVEAALNGVERMYLLSPLTTRMLEHEQGAIAAAQAAGVRHVVLHSNLGTDAENGITLQRWHGAGEKLVEASGMAWTFVRPTGFMSNAFGWAGMIKAQGVVYAPGGDGKIGVVDPRDIAAVAVHALTEDGHEGKIYDVTGPEALSTAEQVQAIADAIGKPLHYVDIPESAAREQMLKAGIPADRADLVLEFMSLVRSGQSAAVSDAVMRVTGRRPRTFADWARENAAAFM